MNSIISSTKYLASRETQIQWILRIWCNKLKVPMRPWESHLISNKDKWISKDGLVTVLLCWMVSNLICQRFRNSLQDVSWKKSKSLKLVIILLIMNSLMGLWVVSDSRSKIISNKVIHPINKKGLPLRRDPEGFLNLKFYQLMWDLIWILCNST